MELVEVGKSDFQNKNVSDDSQDKIKAHLSTVVNYTFIKNFLQIDPLMMKTDQSIIESERGLEPEGFGMTNSQKTHCEDIPDVSDDSQDKDVEIEKKSITATTSEKT